MPVHALTEAMVPVHRVKMLRTSV